MSLSVYVCGRDQSPHVWARRQFSIRGAGTPI